MKNRLASEKIILIFILAVIWLLKFYYFTNLIIPAFDPYEYLLTAKALWNSRSPLIDLGMDDLRFTFHEPGYSILIALFYPLFKDFELSARFVTVTASILSIFLVYLIMEKIKRGCGKYAAVLVATSSLHLQFSSLILREIVGFCLICFILYFFYARKSFQFYRIILLGFLIACASLVHLSNIFLLIPFLYLILKERKFWGAVALIAAFSVIIGPYIYLRLFKWPWTMIDTYYSGLYPTLIFDFLKAVFSEYIRFEPLIMISGFLGITLSLRKNIASGYLLNNFWWIYLLSYLSFFLCWFIKIGFFGYSYIFPLFFPLILAGSIYAADIFQNNFITSRQLELKWTAVCMLITYMLFIHWRFVDLFIKKAQIQSSVYLKYGVLSFVFLSGMAMLFVRPFYRRITLRHIVAVILIALSIQVLDETVQIKGRYTIISRAKELSPQINALKGNILPEDAYFIGVEDVIGILYHTGYPVFYEDFDRISHVHSLGLKWVNKNMTRLITLSRHKPVICVYDHLYRYYLTGMGIEPYEMIQEECPEKLVFSNLKLNVKIYILDNTSGKTNYTNAIKFFNERLKVDTFDTDSMNYLAWSYFCSGNFDRAINIWQRKLSINGNDADTHNNLGLAYDRKGDYQQAISEYEKALESRPLDDPHRIRWAKSMIYFNLAKACEKAKEKDRAITNWQKYYNSIPYPENEIIMKRHINM